MYQTLLRMLGALCLVVMAPAAIAMDLPLTAPQLDSMLQLTFSVSYDSGPYHIILRNPKVQFYGEAHRIGIHAQLKVTGPQGGHFDGHGTVSGALHFDRQQQSLQLVRPELNSLHVNSITPDFKPMLKQARAALEGHQLPVIVLLDIHQLHQILPMANIEDIRVGKDALIVSF